MNQICLNILFLLKFAVSKVVVQTIILPFFCVFVKFHLLCMYEWDDEERGEGWLLFTVCLCSCVCVCCSSLALNWLFNLFYCLPGGIHWLWVLWVNKRAQSVTLLFANVRCDCFALVCVCLTFAFKTNLFRFCLFWNLLFTLCSCHPLRLVVAVQCKWGLSFFCMCV